MGQVQLGPRVQLAVLGSCPAGCVWVTLSLCSYKSTLNALSLAGSHWIPRAPRHTRITRESGTCVSRGRGAPCRSPPSSSCVTQPTGPELACPGLCCTVGTCGGLSTSGGALAQLRAGSWRDPSLRVALPLGPFWVFSFFHPCGSSNPWQHHASCC